VLDTASQGPHHRWWLHSESSQKWFIHTIMVLWEHNGDQLENHTIQWFMPGFGIILPYGSLWIHRITSWDFRGKDLTPQIRHQKFFFWKVLASTDNLQLVGGFKYLWFSIIYGIILPIDELIFFKMVKTC
jgi:hypothetical protein